MKQNTFPGWEILISANQLEASISYEFCHFTPLVMDVNIPRDFQQDKMKFVKLKIKVGVIHKNYESDFFFFSLFSMIFLLDHSSMGFLAYSYCVFFLSSPMFYSYRSSLLISLFVSDVYCLSCSQGFLLISSLLFLRCICKCFDLDCVLSDLHSYSYIP